MPAQRHMEVFHNWCLSCFLFRISICAVWRLMEIQLRPVLPLPPHLVSQSASRSMSSWVNSVQLNTFSTWHPNKRSSSERSQRSNRQQRHKNYLRDTEWPRLSVLVPIMHRADKRAGKQRWRFLSAWQLQRGCCHILSNCKRTVMGRFLIFLSLTNGILTGWHVKGTPAYKLF